jgi:hypothetical protein
MMPLLVMLMLASLASFGAESLSAGFARPPMESRLRAYWWWLNGNVTSNAITRDLEEMKAMGFGGALICDADGSSQDGNARAPHGPAFFSPQWRALYKHTLNEAGRLGLEMSLNIQSGWNLGGPMVPASDAPKKLVWTVKRLQGGTNVTTSLMTPRGRDGFYQDLFVMAVPVNPAVPAGRKPVQNLAQKALLDVLKPFSAPNTAPLFAEFPATPGEADFRATDVMDLTSKCTTNGLLRCELPPGSWDVIRFGCTLNDQCRVSTCSEEWDGYAIDPFDAGAFTRYWNAVVEPLIADAGTYAGTTLKYLHTDSWEVEVANWTPTLREEFQKRRGYDPLPWLPVIAGKIVGSRDECDRFLHDFRRTIGDLAIDNHYRLFKDFAHRHGLWIHPESGGPHAVPIDAQQCLGYNDAPMSEFWAWSWRHRIGDENRFFVKQPASAAHTYGRRLVLAEGFTTIGPHWQETLWDNLKPSFDHACTEGLNLLVWHAFVCSPSNEGMPGQQYFAGTHLNPNVTWWAKSAPFFDYINRCQFMLQQGLPVADVAFFYGDHVPNFAQLRKSDPARLGAGYDYDVVTAEVLLNRMTVKAGRLVLPEGTSYRMLVLPDRQVISLPVLRKLKELAASGATLVGPKPRHSTGLEQFPTSDAEVAKLAEEVWGAQGGGRVIADRTVREVLLEAAVKPDFECEAAGDAASAISYIHRVVDDADLYFVANRSTNAVSIKGMFRMSGRTPEIWNPVDGSRASTAFEEKNGRIGVPLDFAPCGSWFVVFRKSSMHPAITMNKMDGKTTVRELHGPWTVAFDPKWGGPASVTFDNLTSWTDRAEPGIRFYSGTAVYRKTFDMPPEAGSTNTWLDLGEVRELAEVKVNGQSCGIVWTPPFRVDITRALRPGANELVIEVVNFWPNRIIGDAGLLPQQRLTRTNIRRLTSETPLMRSGLFGPVTVLEQK